MPKGRVEKGQHVRLADSDGRIGEVIAIAAVGGTTQCHVVFSDHTSAWVPEERLRSAPSLADRFAAGDYDPRPLRFAVRAQAWAMRWANSVTGELLASRVEPLPHQVLLTHRVVSAEPVRKLIADDVGLGKTIEAGMVVSALRSRGRAARVLFIVPAGLVPQWIEELEEKFDIAVTRLVGESLPTTPRQWENVRYAIGSIDLLKMRPEEMRAAGHWDVVVIDEAHRLSRKGRDVALRYRLAEQLVAPERCGAVVFLTGTPHQGDNEKFIHLLRLVRPDLLRQLSDLIDSPDVVNEIVVRNRKLDVTDQDGTRIFDPPPSVSTDRVRLSPPQRQFHYALEQYLRRSLANADDMEAAKGRAVGFVMTTYSKLATSSPRAIGRALKRRRERLRSTRALFENTVGVEDERFAGETEEAEAAGTQAKIGSFFDGEIEAVGALVGLVEACEAEDAKINKLIQLVTRLLSMTPDERFLIFTEYRGTQEYVVENLQRMCPDRRIVVIHGSQNMEARLQAVAAFSSDATFLVSTEAGAEGINLQERCHILINYDLPWNPMRLRQRVGRLYRFGQERQVVVHNLRTDGSTDESILEHLEAKIEQVVRDLAALEGDKEENLRADVLGRTVAEVPIDELVMAVHRGRSPDRVKDDVSRHMENVRECARLQRALLGGLDEFSLEEYKKIRSPFNASDVWKWVKRAATEVGGSAREAGDSRQVSLPPQLARRGSNIARDYLDVVTERSGAPRNRRSVQFLFGTDAFDALVEEVVSPEFGGEVARRGVLLPGCTGTQRFFEFHFAVDWLTQDLRSGIEEFVVVLVGEDGAVSSEPWVPRVVGAVELREGDKAWNPPPEDRRRALGAATASVDGRRERVYPTRLPQPARLVAAALLTVSGDQV